MDSLTEKKNTGISRCLYCQSTSYGKGCRYNPTGVHFHPSDPRKCSYCGSTSYGKGCTFNPFNKFHMHGIDYNSMISEAVNNHFLLRELNKSYIEFEAYKLGLIDSDGNRVKEPVTEQEIAAYSPTTKTILKIKKYLGSKLELINQTNILESYCKVKYNKETHQKALQFEDTINNIISQLHEATDNALKEGLSVEQVEAILRK